MKVLATSLLTLALVAGPIVSESAANSLRNPAAASKAATSSVSNSISQSAATAAEGVESTMTANSSILQLTTGNPELTTLAMLVEKAGLVDYLNATENLTVFAPTDAAFASMNPGMLKALLQPENMNMLKDVLSYHILPQAVAASDIKSGLTVATAEGEKLAFNADNGVTVNGANVLKSDMQASNGVVHVIDQVLLPASLKAAF